MNPWAFILATTIGLGLSAQQFGVEFFQDESKLWADAQDSLNDALREAWLSAQLEMRRTRINSAELCGCATCREYLRRETLGRN